MGSAAAFSIRGGAKRAGQPHSGGAASPLPDLVPFVITDGADAPIATEALTLLLVSHDRDFLDRLVTSIIAVEGKGVVHEYVGGYTDYLRQRGDALMKLYISFGVLGSENIPKIATTPDLRSATRDNSREPDVG